MLYILNKKINNRHDPIDHKADIEHEVTFLVNNIHRNVLCNIISHKGDNMLLLKIQIEWDV